MGKKKKIFGRGEEELFSFGGNYQIRENCCNSHCYSSSCNSKPICIGLYITCPVQHAQQTIIVTYIMGI